MRTENVEFKIWFNEIIRKQKQNITVLKIGMVGFNYLYISISLAVIYMRRKSMMRLGCQFQMHNRKWSR